MIAERARAICVVASGSLLAACGAESADPRPTDPPVSRAWRFVEREYPFVGEHGETVCAERRRQTVEGLEEIKREFYDFGKINDKLAGRLELDSGVRAAIAARGLEKVTSCAEAREFMTVQREYFQSLSSTTAAFQQTEVPLVDKVRDGFQYDHYASVRVRMWYGESGIGTCTGILLNKYAILTAAHCFMRSGMWRVSVDYGEVFGEPWCISSNAPNCNSYPAADNFMVYRHPNFTGCGEAGCDDNDLALAVEWDWAPWNVIGDDAAYYMLLTKSAPVIGTTFWFQGYGGTGAGWESLGTGRRSNQQDTITWLTPQYWWSDVNAGFGHSCEGDSGSAAVNTDKTNWPNGIALGILSWVLFPDGNCTAVGSPVFWGRIDAQINWINDALIASESPTCVPGDNPGWQVYRCW